MLCSWSLEVLPLNENSEMSFVPLNTVPIVVVPLIEDLPVFANEFGGLSPRYPLQVNGLFQLLGEVKQILLTFNTSALKGPI